MKYLLIITALIGCTLANASELKFYVLPVDSKHPEVFSSFIEYQKSGPKLKEPAITVNQLLEVKETTAHSESGSYNSAGKFEKVWALDSPALAITLPIEFSDQFEKLTSENVGGSVMMVLDDTILITPAINQPIKTNRFEISLNSKDQIDMIAKQLRTLIRK